MSKRFLRPTFTYFAPYNDELGCIQVFRERLTMQHVDVLDKTIEFSKIEMIHTEDSFMYAVPGVAKIACSASYDEFQFRADEKKGS